MKRFSFYVRKDSKQEPISTTEASDRLSAARFFAGQKKLTLKEFLRIFSISR